MTLRLKKWLVPGDGGRRRRIARGLQLKLEFDHGRQQSGDRRRVGEQHGQHGQPG